MSATSTVKHRDERGTKRAADDSLDDEQRFAKRFNLLNLVDRDGSKLYIPLGPKAQLSASTNGPRSDGMNIDDTKDRIYIHDLDAELADIDSSEPEERLIFLPDIEKKFNKLPKHLLTSSRIESGEGQELVLYRLPESLTVEKERDSVRKAVAEARQRAREKAVVENGVFARAEEHEEQMVNETAHGLQAADYAPEEDPDAMDLG